MDMCLEKITENGTTGGKKTREETKAQNDMQRVQAAESKRRKASELLTTLGYTVLPPWAQGAPLPCTWEANANVDQIPQEPQAWHPDATQESLGASSSNEEPWPASVAKWRTSLWHDDAPADAPAEAEASAEAPITWDDVHHTMQEGTDAALTAKMHFPAWYQKQEQRDLDAVPKAPAHPPGLLHVVHPVRFPVKAGPPAAEAKPVPAETQQPRKAPAAQQGKGAPPAISKKSQPPVGTPDLTDVPAAELVKLAVDAAEECRQLAVDSSQATPPWKAPPVPSSASASEMTVVPNSPKHLPMPGYLPSVPPSRAETIMSLTNQYPYPFSALTEYLGLSKKASPVNPANDDAEKQPEAAKEKSDAKDNEETAASTDNAAAKKVPAAAKKKQKLQPVVNAS